MARLDLYIHPCPEGERPHLWIPFLETEAGSFLLDGYIPRTAYLKLKGGLPPLEFFQAIGGTLTVAERAGQYTLAEQEEDRLAVGYESFGSVAPVAGLLEAVTASGARLPLTHCSVEQLRKHKTAGLFEARPAPVQGRVAACTNSPVWG